MKAAVVQRALALGFDACRITAAEPPDGAARFEAWLAAGHHGAMDYLARNAAKRVDPQRVLPGARSVIVLAASYGHSTTPLPANQAASHGEIARYARHTDYHDLLAVPLRNLAAFVDELGGAGTRSLWYVDTGPVLERDLAQRAGLGFIGKHTNLINRQLGNWFLLAEILTTLRLEPDPPEPNRCGHCTRCLAACPTNAFVAPFQLDARRCLAYLTIEWKGSIPVDFRPALGRRIFGCDDCLAVCPWNRFARTSRLLQEHVRPELATPDLIELLGLDDAAFRLRFAGTPLLRAKRRGFLRNVATALGNVGDARALPALARAAGDPEPLIAEHAAWALAQIEERQSRPPVPSHTDTAAADDAPTDPTGSRGP